ncbi:MAG: esterase [Thermoanaerobaculia bacterium]|nr:esterase [Thermoanaerobaculia bacterium]
MKRQHVMIDSPSMGRKVHVWAYGHWGAPVLVFPTAAGFAHEWERQGMVETLAPLIYGGKIKLYCPESNVAEAWTRRDSDPEWRIQRHKAYEEFVVSTLVAAIRADCNSPQIKIATTGASLGAFYAANIALKYPETFHYALCMSGRYEMSHFADGHDSLDVYFNNPLAYVGRLNGESLERIRRNTHLTLVCGQGMWEEGCIEETHALANLLAAKEISHHRDIWGHDVSHDWIWWKRQAFYHLRRTFA